MKQSSGHAVSGRIRGACLGTIQQVLLLTLLVFGVSWINQSSEIMLSGLIGSAWARWLFASIGTPVHEISHAAVALLFGYRIVEFRPFIADPTSPTLGFVRYSYTSGTFLSQVGHFFVGIAPVLVPLAFLYLLYRFLLPRNLVNAGRLQWRQLWSLGNLLRCLLFIYISAQIVFHMRCSPADLQNATYGLPLLVGLLLVIGLVYPRGQRYLLASSTMMTILSLVFAIISQLIVRGAVMLFG